MKHRSIELAPITKEREWRQNSWIAKQKTIAKWLLQDKIIFGWGWLWSYFWQANS